LSPSAEEKHPFKTTQAEAAFEDDITVRLRRFGHHNHEQNKRFCTSCEAAVDIERLRDEIVALTASNEIMQQASEKYNAEIERLRADAPKVEWNALVKFVHFTQDGWNIGEAAEKAGIEYQWR
jgi:hypothetical protein